MIRDDGGVGPSHRKSTSQRDANDEMLSPDAQIALRQPLCTYGVVRVSHHHLKLAPFLIVRDRSIEWTVLEREVPCTVQ